MQPFNRRRLLHNLRRHFQKPQRQPAVISCLNAETVTARLSSEIHPSSGHSLIASGHHHLHLRLFIKDGCNLYLISLFKCTEIRQLSTIGVIISSPGMGKHIDRRNIFLHHFDIQQLHGRVPLHIGNPHAQLVTSRREFHRQDLIRCAS